MVTPGALPVPGTALIGRTAECAAIENLLLSRAATTVTLTGPPGVGKTRLALAVAADVADRFADGVVWVDLAPIRTPRLMIAEIARALNVQRPAAEPSLETVAAALTDRELLVVLDNCEQLLDDGFALAELLDSTRRVQVLATSRERLHLSAEQEFAVPPLPMPLEIDDLDQMRRNPAVALLLARSPRGISLTARTARALADICLRLDGLPLSLELAAARLRVFTPSELAFRLEHQMTTLSRGPRGVPGRHHDLRAAITWSHELLPDIERTVFRRLSVFGSDWTLADADAVCADPTMPGVVDAVESLLEKNLIRRVDGEIRDGGDPDGGQARFGMLMSLREFAAEQLDQSGELAVLRTRHAAHFALQARRWEATVGTDAETATWPILGRIRGDLRAAFDESQGRLDPDGVLWLATCLGWFGYTRGSLTDGGLLIDVVASTVEDPRTSPDAGAAALIASGIVALGLGDLDSAARDLRRSYVLSLEDGNDRRLAVASAFLGHVARRRSAFDDAAEHYGTARTIYERLGSTRGMAWAAHDLGLLAGERGELPEAESLLREAVLLFDVLDYAWAIAVSSCALASVLLRGGDVAEPAALLGRALALHDSVGDRRGVAQCLESLAEVALERGAATTAARLSGAAAAQRERVGAVPTEAEQSRLDHLVSDLERALGRPEATHERHAGRTMPASAAIALAARTAGGVVSAGTPGTAGVAVGRDVELTPRQLEVANLVAVGNTNRQIGRALGISEKTAEVHVRNIMERLQAPNRAGVAAWVSASASAPAPAPAPARDPQPAP